MSVTKIAAGIGVGASSIIKGGKGATGLLKSQGITPYATFNALNRVRGETAQGRSLGAGILKGAATGVAYSAAPHLMGAIDISKMAISGTKSAINFRHQRGQEIALGETYGRVGGNFMDTGQAQTMRQAAVQQIQHNKLNARSALGGEARIFSGRKYNQHTRPYI